MSHESLNNLLGSRDPANPRAGRNDLGEGIHAHDSAVNVHAKVCRDECFEEGLVVLWWWDVGCVRPGVGLHLEKVVGLVFDYVDIVFLAYFVDVLSSLDSLCCAGRVLA